MNLKPEELVKALRCTSTPGKPTGDCEMCPYYRRENLNDELKEKLGTDTWTSCDVDKVGMDASDQIERDQKEMAELRAALEKATEIAGALNKKCDLITKKLEQLSDAYHVVGDSEEGHAMNEPLTLQELVELNGQPVWMGEPFNQWTTISIDPKYIKSITPGMKIRKGAMNVNGERVEIPPVNFYREPRLTRQERIEKMKTGGDYRPQFTCGDCPEWHKTVCSGNCRKNMLEWLEQHNIENCKEG